MDSPAQSTLGRNVGLTARALTGGVGSLASIIGDPANVIANFALQAMGQKPLPMLSEAVAQGQRAAGLPMPETIPEKLSGAGISAMAGAGALGKLAQGARNLPMISQPAQLLADSPIAQALASMFGLAATETAKEGGVENPMALGALSIGGGLLGGAGATSGQRIASALPQLARPLTTRGKERIVGEAFNRLTDTPAATAERLATAPTLVPGSRPMVHEVAKDAGLIGAFKPLQGMDTTGVMASRAAQNNAARQAELERIAGTESTLAQAEAKRDRTFPEMAEPAFDNAAPIKIGRDWISNPILRTIQTIRESPAGARQTVREALDEAQAMLTTEGVDLTNARVLYEIRKDLDLVRTGKLTGAGASGRERANMRTAESQLSQVIKSLDETIEGGAPGYRDYMRMFAKRSVPVDQLKALQSLRERAVTSVPDPVTDQPILAQHKFTNLLKSNMAPNPNYRRAPLNGRGPGEVQMRGSVPGTREPVLANLSSQHIRTLDRIAQDLDRSVSANAATMRVQGSDTFKNMSVAAVIGRVLGDKTGELAKESTAVKTMTSPLSFLYRIPDRDIQMLMLEAWTDPKLAGQLMQRASREQIEDIAKVLKDRAGRQAAASALYGGE